MKIAHKIDSIVKSISSEIPGGNKFFDKIDDAIKKNENQDIILELFNRIYNDFNFNFNMIISGGFGDLVMYLLKSKKIICHGSILQVAGGITSHFGNMNSAQINNAKIEKVVGDIYNKDFIFIDDSYYSGTTKISIDNFLKKFFSSKIIKTYVIYDGNDTKSKDRISLYNYYDWNRGSKRKLTELYDELYKYNDIPYDIFEKDILNGKISSVIELRKKINDFKIKSNQSEIDIHHRIREKKSTKRFKKIIYNEMLMYSNFILEQKIYSLFLESKVQFSKNFMSILSSMDNPIAKSILGLQDQDKDVTQNYIDSDLKSIDMITFIQDRRAKQLTKDKEDNFKIIKDQHLKVSDFQTEEGEAQNTEIYRLLDLDIKKANRAETGTEVKVIKKIVSPYNSSKTYCSYVSLDSKYNGVINVEALIPSDEVFAQLWSVSRNSMRIGRLVRSLLPLTGKKFTDSEIEKFVNEYKSVVNIMNDAFSKFDIVSNDDVIHFYNISNYASEDGTLGSSCMADVPDSYLYIYANNPDVCKLVILYDDKGSLKDGKYKSTKIMGRALLWKTTDGTMFMDRIYTVNQNDEELFKKFAARNGWWCKKTQNSSDTFTAEKGSESKDKPEYVVQLTDWDDNFPYIDTLCYLNSKTGKLSNRKSLISANKVCNDTGGEPQWLDDDDDDD